MNMTGMDMMTMTHPGLPLFWAMVVMVCMAALALWVLAMPLQAATLRKEAKSGIGLFSLPVIGQFMQRMFASAWVIRIGKFISVALFLLVIAAGLAGSPIPERNLAPSVTWTFWWTLLIFSILLFGSAWCAICPWDTLATWLVRRRLWNRGAATTSLNMRVPRFMRNVWPAFLLLVGLTWMEIGRGITSDPLATASLALLMVVLATMSQAFFERKAFCHYFCPVGRTIGFYSQIAPVGLRPIDQSVCDSCTTLDCYHGTETVPPCPTHLVMGRMKQNTYCLSCGDCLRSCPSDNIGWHSRTLGQGILDVRKPQMSEAYFIVGLLALTSLHGFTMTPWWDGWMIQSARLIGDSGQLLWSFSLGMILFLAAPVLVYWLVAYVTSRLLPAITARHLFASMAYATLPLALSYHLAHNLTHLVRESAGFSTLVMNPFGTGMQPLTMMERHMRMNNLILPEAVIFSLQVGLMIFGFWVAMRVLRQSSITEYLVRRGLGRAKMMPILLFICSISLADLWLLMQPMIMRM